MMCYLLNVVAPSLPQARWCFLDMYNVHIHYITFNFFFRCLLQYSNSFETIQKMRRGNKCIFICIRIQWETNWFLTDNRGIPWLLLISRKSDDMSRKSFSWTIENRVLRFLMYSLFFKGERGVKCQNLLKKLRRIEPCSPSTGRTRETIFSPKLTSSRI